MTTTTLQDLIDEVVVAAKSVGRSEMDIYGRSTAREDQELSDCLALLNEALIEVDLDLNAEIPIEWDSEKQRYRLV